MNPARPVILTAFNGDVAVVVNTSDNPSKVRLARAGLFAADRLVSVDESKVAVVAALKVATAVNLSAGRFTVTADAAVIVPTTAFKAGSESGVVLVNAAAPPIDTNAGAETVSAVTVTPAPAATRVGRLTVEVAEPVIDRAPVTAGALTVTLLPAFVAEIVSAVRFAELPRTTVLAASAVSENVAATFPVKVTDVATNNVDPAKPVAGITTVVADGKLAVLTDTVVSKGRFTDVVPITGVAAAAAVV